MSPGIPVQEFWLFICICSVCPWAVCSATVDLKFDLLLCRRHTRDVSSTKDSEIDTQMGQTISPETAAVLWPFRARCWTETTLFEHSRAVPRHCQAWSCLLMIFPFMTLHCGHYKVKSAKCLSQEGSMGGNVEGGRVLKQFLMLRQHRGS